MIKNVVTDPSEALKTPKKYLIYIAMAWATCLTTAILAATKIIDIGPFQFSVAVIIYPITYIFSDVFTEVYGYRQTRRIIWTGFALFLFVSFFMSVMTLIPPSADYKDNDAFHTVFSSTPLITVAAILAFYFGEMTNSFILAKMKLWTNGKYLWSRTIASTIGGQFVDQFIFYFVAFGIAATYPPSTLINLSLSTAGFCILYEFLATPLTYKVIGSLKKHEGVDVYDVNTNFNPLKWR